MVPYLNTWNGLWAADCADQNNTKNIFLAQSGSSIKIAFWNWPRKTQSPLRGSSCSVLLFGAVGFLVVLIILSSLALPDVMITNILENDLLVMLLSPSSCPRTLTTTRLDHPCVSTSLTRDQTTSRGRLQTNTNKIKHLSRAATTWL